MSELPVGWDTDELGNFLTVHYGKALASASRASEGNIPVIGSSGKVGHHDEALVDGPCLVVGRKGAAGTVHLVQESCWPIDTAYFIQPPSEIDLDFLHHFLSFQPLEQLDKSTAIPSLSRDDLYQVRMPVAPRAEQTRIVEKLEALLGDLDVAVAELKAAQRKLASLRQSLLKAAVDGTLTAEWRAAHGKPQQTGADLLQRILRERRARWETKQLAKFAAQGKTPPKGWQAKYPEPVAPDTTDLPQLPDGWVWATIDQLAASVRNGLSQKPEQEPLGYPILRINAVRAMSVNLDEVRYLPISADEAENYLLENGDLLATRYNGSVDLLGVVGVVRGLTRETLHPDKLIRIQPVLDEHLADWIEVAASTGVSRAHIVSRVKTTAGQTGISGDDLKRMPVPLSPTEEQHAIIEQLDTALSACDTQQAAIDHALQQAAAQRRNLLKTAFAGQLVPQDPADEPASELLARIRAAKAQMPAAHGRKRAGANPAPATNLRNTGTRSRRSKETG